MAVAVVIHVAGLWITSPPDMIDALLFTSPTPFSPLRCDRDVGDLRRGAFGRAPPAIGAAERGASLIRPSRWSSS